MKGVAEEELEVALIRFHPLPRYQPDGQRDERKRGERRNQPARPAGGRTRCRGDISGGNVCGE
jgi:hypothetical protein